jgi:hypothetical protein
VEVRRSRPALQSADLPMLRRRLGAASSAPVKPAAAAAASESRAESPDATWRDEHLRRSAMLRHGGVAAGRHASGSVNLRRSSFEDALATCYTDTCGGDGGTCCFYGVVAINGWQWQETGGWSGASAGER